MILRCIRAVNKVFFVSDLFCRSYVFSESRVSLPAVYLYNAKEKSYLERLTIVFEHDGYELVRVTHKAKCKYSHSWKVGTSFDIVSNPRPSIFLQTRN